MQSLVEDFPIQFWYFELSVCEECLCGQLSKVLGDAHGCQQRVVWLSLLLLYILELLLFLVSFYLYVIKMFVA